MCCYATLRSADDARAAAVALWDVAKNSVNTNSQVIPKSLLHFSFSVYHLEDRAFQYHITGKRSKSLEDLCASMQLNNDEDEDGDSVDDGVDDVEGSVNDVEGSVNDVEGSVNNDESCVNDPHPVMTCCVLGSVMFHRYSPSGHGCMEELNSATLVHEESPHPHGQKVWSLFKQSLVFPVSRSMVELVGQVDVIDSFFSSSNGEMVTGEVTLGR